MQHRLRWPHVLFPSFTFTSPSSSPLDQHCHYLLPLHDNVHILVWVSSTQFGDELFGLQWSIALNCIDQDRTTTQSPAATQAHRQAATQTLRHITAPTHRQPQAQTAARRQARSPGPAPHGRPLRPPNPCTKGLAAKAPSTMPPRQHRRRRRHLLGGTRDGRGATSLIPTPSKTRTPDPQATPPPPPGPEQHQGQPVVPPRPFQPGCLPISGRGPTPTLREVSVT